MVYSISIGTDTEEFLSQTYGTKWWACWVVIFWVWCMHISIFAIIKFPVYYNCRRERTKQKPFQNCKFCHIVEYIGI